MPLGILLFSRRRDAIVDIAAAFSCCMKFLIAVGNIEDKAGSACRSWWYSLHDEEADGIKKNDGKLQN